METAQPKREPHPTLSPDDQQTIGLELQDMLFELVDLSLVGKQLHWTVVGPTFLALHRQLDELVDSWRELADRVAERSVALGFYPDGQARPVMETCEIFGFEAIEPGPVADRDVIIDLTARLSETIGRTRTRAATLASVDVVTEDLLIEIVGVLEHQLWMLRAQRER